MRQGYWRSAAKTLASPPIGINVPRQFGQPGATKLHGLVFSFGALNCGDFLFGRALARLGLKSRGSFNAGARLKTLRRRFARSQLMIGSLPKVPRW